RSSLLAALVICPAPRSTLFPYTTLFRSVLIHATSTKTRWKSVRGNVRGNGINGRYVHRAGREGRPDELLRYSLVPDGHRTHHQGDRKSTRLNSSHVKISYAVFCLKKKTN